MVTGRISFVGAGPGAADLITMRGARRIAEADIVLWTASLVTPECVREHVRADAELVDSSRLSHEQTLEVYRRAERDRLNLVRLHPGDPSLWGAVQEQHDMCARMAVEVEIVPGVAGFSAAAASIGRELAAPDVAQSLVLSQMESGNGDMPGGEKIREFAKHGTTMTLFLSAARVGQLVEELQAGGYTDDTPVVVAHKVTWPDELVLRTTLGDLPSAVKQHKLWRHTLFLVGNRLAGGGTRANRYRGVRTDSSRRADERGRRQLRIERGDERSAALGKNPAHQHGPPARGDGGVRDSDVAWWAVRDWQQTARGAARVAATRAADRHIDEAQPDLFAPAPGGEAETGGLDESAQEDRAFHDSAPEEPGSENAGPESAASEDPGAENPAPEAPTPEDPASSPVEADTSAASRQSASGRSGSTSGSSTSAKPRAKSQKSTGTGKQTTGKKSGKATAKTATSTSGAKADDAQR